ncbi:hypothetical protein H6S82_25640 [Planktothrix sp. FACHB-1355]|uniref:Uncharacterized protein n=1 Tax=Aerosakkonema funiforme FACHB-1375 TaxID=2949571 RepID=A0A926VKM8_9CYAN|nr:MULTISPECIES: hypothetical protein [Oscillatoriales]MBD2184169.1 hypothetical protein [Aerosakkonema funiforme FACHB-1375]MBD3562202.1 hypothetical protein [Planktothrix sp. FACHB-1355]
MLITTELRWFNRGKLPEDIKDWFNGDALGEHHQSPEEREDIYLYIPECEYLGIKLRQQRLEIKLRKAELDTLSFGDNVEGKAEKWVKWSCEDATAESLIPADALKKRPWVSVKKVRSQRKYQVSADASVTSVPVDKAINQGCNVEITQLDIKDNLWWSLALEAFGEDANLMYNLETVSIWLFQTYSASKLQVQNSSAYPQWLAFQSKDLPKKTLF